MTQTTAAVYENGVLRPVQPLALAEGETVQLTVTTPAPRPSDDDWKAGFDRLLALARSRADRYPPGFRADVSREGMYEGCGE